MIILQDFTKDELVSFITSTYSKPRFVAEQIFSWLNKGAEFDEMTNVSAEFRQILKTDCVAQSVKIEKCLESKIDGTKKFLYSLTDGSVIEGVLMSYKHGNTLCVSTQVGCAMGCKFCASTLNGLIRNLTPGEILGQVVAVNAFCGKNTRNVTNVVLMGSGEPLHNFENTVKFIKLLSSEHGLNFSQRNISLSTCGLADKMRELADLDLSVNLTLSLHSPFQEKRAEIMPIAKKFDVSEIISALRYYFEKTKRRVIIEYTLISGVNDTYADALKLKELLKNMSAHVNLIRLNTVKERKLRATSTDNAKTFLGYLEKMKISATLRRQLGADVNGACGQLRNEYMRNDGGTL